MLSQMLHTIDNAFKLTSKEVGEYRSMKVNGMKFTIWAYDAAGLGHVSAMHAEGFFGLMKMDTLIVTPTVVDMPLLSYDRDYAMGNDTLIVELYDTLLSNTDLTQLSQCKQNCAQLPDHDLGSHWYDSIKLTESLSKKGKKQHTKAFDEAAHQYLMRYLQIAGTAANCDMTQKLEKASVYVEGLLSHGGPSTDVFKKGIGEQKTADLFRHVLFGTTSKI